MDAPAVLYIPDLARKLSLTEKAVSRRLERAKGAGAPQTLPPHFRLGGRIAWRAEVVDAWLAAKDTAGTRFLKAVSR